MSRAFNATWPDVSDLRTQRRHGNVAHRQRTPLWRHLRGRLLPVSRRWRHGVVRGSVVSEWKRGGADHPRSPNVHSGHRTVSVHRVHFHGIARRLVGALIDSSLFIYCTAAEIIGASVLVFSYCFTKCTIKQDMNFFGQICWNERPNNPSTMIHLFKFVLYKVNPWWNKYN